MSMPSLDPVTPMEIAQQPQPVPPLQPLQTVTPMDTTPAPVNTVTTNLTSNVVNIATTHSNITTGTVNVPVPPTVTAPPMVNKPVVVQATSAPVLNISSPTTSSVSSSVRSTVSSSVAPSTSLSSTHEPTQVLSRARLQDLVREVDPSEQLDEEVEELLLQLADDFVENAVNAACLFAKHRRANTIDVKDVQLHLERNWNMWIPGFGTDELRPYKRASVTEAHKQRLALIRKALKKY